MECRMWEVTFARESFGRSLYYPLRRATYFGTGAADINLVGLPSDP